MMSYVWLIKNEKVQLVLIFGFLLLAMIKYSYVTMTTSVAFITYKFWNLLWEKYNEKFCFNNVFDKQFDFFK